ncbi:MAG: prepilin-type N-terminal cleavage/methylation domain-containing protein [Planctomycetota bacterium]|nr:prepilin-type N-terminal cleavage/methylation domain-containing protein [Planctomycetota bacterium]
MIPRAIRTNRNGFSLLELLLALALTAVVSILIGGMVQLFLVNETRGRDSVRQAQMARAILNMIAEDVRTTVRYYPYDTSGLDQMLGSAMNNATGGALGALTGGAGAGAGAGGGTGAGSGGTGSGGNPSSGGNTNPTASAGGSTPGGNSTAGGGNASGAASGTGGMSGGLGGSSAGGMNASGSGSTAGGQAQGEAAGPTVIPPGIFGSASSIEIDVSRLPRPDEYVIQPGNINTGSLGDMPSDIKTVGYYVQAPRSDGVQDPLASLTSQFNTSNSGSTTGQSGGLVRRSLDRAVTQYAYEMGNSDQLIRTGEIIAPEVLGIDFSYFGANGWQTEWDSVSLGLPSVVKVTIAMQRESSARTNPMAPGISLSTLNNSMIQEYGIELYSMNILIPGAALLASPAGATPGGTSSNGMSSLGL